MNPKIPLLILHGWGRGDSLTQWQPAKTALKAAGFQVFLPVLPGFFGNPLPQPAWYLSNYADFVAQYLADQHLSQPIILGHSFGGSVAVKLAARHSNLIKALILVNSSGIRHKASIKIRLFWLMAKLGKLLFILPPLSLLKGLSRWLLYTLAGEKDYYRAIKVMRPTLKNILGEDLTPVLAQISLPTLIVWGKHDTTTPLSYGQKLHQVIPNSQLRVVDASHGLPFQQPKLLADLVRDFVARL